MPEMTRCPSSSTAAQQILIRARGGDAEAFGALFGACAERVLLYIQLRLSRALAKRLEPEDILQDTALAAFADIASFEPRGRGAFASWLCAIAENRLRDSSDYHAAQKRQAPGKREALTLVLDRLRQSMTSPASRVAREEQHERLRAQLDNLGGDERTALILRFFCGATSARIADELGTSETGARRLLARATCRLGTALGDPA